MAQAEQRVRAATVQPPMSVASTSQTSVMSTGVDTTSAAAQMQAMQHAALSAARAAAPQPPHCLPSTSSATAPAGYPTLAGLPPQALQSLALSGNPQMLSVLQEARRVAAATPKPPQAQMTPQRPPSAMPRPPQQPSGLTLPPGLATLGARRAAAFATALQQHAQAQAQVQAQAQQSGQPSQLDLGIYPQAQAQAQAQQQQAAQAQAQQQHSVTGGVDPREALLRLYSQSSAAGRGGIEAAGSLPPGLAGLAAQHASMGGTPTSQSPLFNPALLGLQGLGAQYAKPFSAGLQQLGQIKRDGNDVIPNGR
ncbi:hypothetical protein OSTOST_03232 [Ostertagia ostertagi]